MTTENLSRLFKPSARLLTNTEAAVYLGVTPRTLEVWRCTKRYPIAYVKVGRLVKYRQESLDVFLQARTVSAESA